MICSANSDIGMKRSVNQDSYVLKMYSERTCLCIVCDGMGGAKGGTEASRIASERFSTVIDNFITPYIGRKDKNLRASDIKNAMIDAAEQANSAVFQYSRTHAGLKGMGTTLVAILAIEHSVFCVNVGDSRMYFMRGPKIKQITKDHSYVQYLLDIGQITEKEAENFPRKNVITRAIGTEPSVRPDFYRESNVPDGTFVLLCSDGLTNFIDDENIRQIVVGDQPRRLDQIELSLITRKLIDTANQNGGADNITAAIIKL